MQSASYSNTVRNIKCNEKAIKMPIEWKTIIMQENDVKV